MLFQKEVTQSCLAPPPLRRTLKKSSLIGKKVGPNKQEVFYYDGGTHYNNGHQGQHEHFSGRVFHFSDQLRFGNASIIIRNAQITDSGDYICVFPRLQPAEETFNVKLLVGEFFIFKSILKIFLSTHAL